MIHCRRNTFSSRRRVRFMEADSCASVFVLGACVVGNRLILPRRQWPAALLTAAFAQHVPMDKFARLAARTRADCTSIKCLSRPDHSRELLTSLFHLRGSIWRSLI